MTQRDNQEISFGTAISQARKARSWSLKDLASRVIREDGIAISPQYLNDIEHGRRKPSSDGLVQQFAKELEIDSDWLYFLAGRIPEDLRESDFPEDYVVESMKVFRRGPNQGTT